VTSSEQLEAARNTWEDLLAQNESDNPFMTWDWLSTWHEHLARGPLNILVAREAGDVIGFVPLERVAYRLPLGIRVPTLQMIGRGSYQYELRSIVAAPGREVDVLGAAVTHLAQGRPRWYCTVLDGFTPGSNAHRAVQRLVEDRVEDVQQTDVTAHVLDLPTSWEAFRGGLKRNIKESLRRCYNSLSREGHVYSFEVWDEPERLPEAMDRFMALHTMRAEHQDGTVKHRSYFQTPQERAFLHAVAPRLLERGILHPCFLRVDGEIVAARLTLELRGQLYLYHSGFDPRWWKYSVATTITAECLKWAIERGLSRANLSVGQDVSKTRWGPREVQYRSVVMLAGGWLPRATLAAYAAIGRRNPRRWKRLLHANPGAARPSQLPATGAESDGLTLASS
jgi:CelD/BcsL family acetyltransferase involved in cellulose biosynthesis